MLDGSIVPAPIELTCGVVVQLYQLFFVHKPPAFTSPRVGFYRVLSALAQTGGGAVQPEAADMHLLVGRGKNMPAAAVAEQLQNSLPELIMGLRQEQAVVRERVHRRLSGDGADTRRHTNQPGPQLLVLRAQAKHMARSTRRIKRRA